MTGTYNLGIKRSQCLPHCC